MKRIAALLLLFLSVAVVAVSAQSGRTSRPRVAPQTTPQTSNQNRTEAPAPKAEAQPNTVPVTEKVIGDDEDVLKVETNLVTIPVSVFDRSGRFVSGLRQQDFKIFEDGKEQEVGYFGSTEQPVTVILVLDTSRSFRLRIEQLQEAAISFVNQLKPTDRVMVIEFDADINVLSELTNDRAKLARAIRKTDFGDGTSIYNTVDYVLKRRLPKIEGRKAIVMFTDGVDTTSFESRNPASAQSNIRDAEESEAPIYTIYYNTINDDMNNNGGGLMSSTLPPWLGDSSGNRMPGTSPRDYAEGKRYLEEITQKSGGRLYDTSQNRNLEDTFADVAEELKRQYNIGYYPTEVGQKGQRKQLKVRVERPGTVVRARESYVVGEEQQTTATEDKQSKRKS